MNGDFSRSTFAAANHFAAVRMQQGSVQLDADWNEQADIVQHQIVTPLSDLLGDFAVSGDPTDPERAGFALSLVEAPGSAGVGPGEPQPPDLQIGSGRGYVNGILCENERTCLYTTQPDYPGAAAQHRALIEAGYARFIVYLDVWQRHITAVENPGIRDSALDGADTAMRSRTTWQVKLLPAHAETRASGTPLAESPAWQALLAGERQRGRLGARQKANTTLRDNQLYRVEVHTADGGAVAFKWSRENGSVAYAVQSIEALPVHDVAEQAALAYAVVLAESDPARLFLRPGDWVELGTDGDVVNGMRRPLFRITDMQPDLGQVTVGGRDALPVVPDEAALGGRWILRRWDQGSANQPGQLDNVDEAGLLVRSPANVDPIDLENGLQVQFFDAADYRPGDYWLIPTRTQFSHDRGGVEWPQDAAGVPLPQSPHGIHHHYALLGLLHQDAGVWVIARQPQAAVLPLPAITGKVLDVVQRVTTVEAEVAGLKQRVEVLEEKVERTLAWLTAERAQLFYDYKADVVLEVGDIVAIDPERDDHVVRASHDNETLVVGVVAKILAGRHGETMFRVTMHGRTRCNVAGSVAPGALLVVSGYEGRAMQGGVFLRPGTVVGKALGSYRAAKKGELGTVDVMVTLA